MLRMLLIVVVGSRCSPRRPPSAQDYPTRPVRIVFPLAAGGGGDVFTRALADELQKAWHQPVVVENRPGGGQNIGARACVEATPDGYTICVMSSEPAVYNQFLFKTIPYDPEKDLQPIANLFFNTLAVVINGDTKVKTLRRDDRDGEAAARQAQLFDVLVSGHRVHGQAEQGRGHRHREGAVPRRRRGGQRACSAAPRRSRCWRCPTWCRSCRAAASRRSRWWRIRARRCFPTCRRSSEARPGERVSDRRGSACSPRPACRGRSSRRLPRDVDRIMAEPAFRKRMYIERGVEPAPERLDEFARFIRDERKLAQQIVKESGLEPK